MKARRERNPCGGGDVPFQPERAGGGGREFEEVDVASDGGEERIHLQEEIAVSIVACGWGGRFKEEM